MPCVSHTTDDPSGLTHAVRDFVQAITSVPTQGEISMVHPSSRFYRCLCRLIIASMLFQTGCYSGHTKYTHYLPTEPRSTFRPLLEIGMWDLEVELRDGSLIKVTPLNSEFGEALYLKAPRVSGRLVSWDEETIRLKKVGVPFRATKRADVFYDIPVAEATNIIFNKAVGSSVLSIAAIGGDFLIVVVTIFTGLAVLLFLDAQSI